MAVTTRRGMAPAGEAGASIPDPFPPQPPVPDPLPEPGPEPVPDPLPAVGGPQLSPMPEAGSGAAPWRTASSIRLPIPGSMLVQ